MKAFLQVLRRRWRVLSLIAVIAIVMAGLTLPGWLFTDRWISPSWLADSGHNGAIKDLYVVDDFLISAGFDGVIALHDKVTLEVLDRIEAKLGITASTVVSDPGGIILGCDDGSLAIIRLSRVSGPAGVETVRLVSAVLRNETGFKSPIVSIAVEKQTSFPAAIVCFEGKVIVGQISLDTNTFHYGKVITGLEYVGSAPCVMSTGPGRFVFAAEFPENLQLIQLDGIDYSVTEVKSSGTGVPRYSAVIPSPNGKLACTLSWRGFVSCSDLGSRREHWRKHAHSPGWLRQAFWVSDSELVTFAAFGELFLPPGFTEWDVHNGNVVRRWQFAEQNSVSCVAALGNSSRVVVGTTTGQIGEVSLQLNEPR